MSSPWILTKDERPKVGRLVVGKTESGHIALMTLRRTGKTGNVLWCSHSFTLRKENRPVKWFYVPE